MSISVRNPYEDPESSTAKWVAIFILLSLLAHAIIIAAILLITVFMPVPKLVVPEPPSTTLTLTPPPPVPAAPSKPIFIPTTPQANAPHKVQPVESANDTELTSQSKTARAPNAIMPDITGKEHAPNLNSTPNVQAPQKPEVSSTPPTPKQAKPEKPTPPQPNPQQGKQTPSPQTPKPLRPAPPQKAPPQVDPLTGLPLLPPISAPTLAPPNSAAQPLAPAPSQQQQAASVHGRVGADGNNSPAAMATALGKYKQKVYNAVGSHWYPKVDNSFQLLGVGVVHIQFTIHSDGTVETKVLDAGDSSTQILLAISINSIREAAPYDPFPPEMVKELISQGGDGTSYTDDFTFSVYGR
jgi:outer membrane biosynthesis protein TonB